MPENIDARIIVTTEASAAKQGIDNVKNGLKGITDARERDLKIAQAKSQMEIAEYRSEIAAQKAYNAELQLETAEKLKQQRIKRGADASEIKKRTERIQQFRGEVLKLQQAEATANLQAYQSKKAYESLLEPINKATVNTGKLAGKTKDLTAAQILARFAGRALGIGIEGTSTQMIKLGIIAAGAASAVKLLKFAYEEYRRSIQDNVDLEDENAKSIKEVEERLRNRLEARKSDLQTLAEYGGHQNLTAEQSFKLGKAVENLGKNFRGLKLEIADTSGNLKDFSRIAAEEEMRINAEQIASISRQIAGNNLAIREREEAMRNAGVSLDWYKEYDWIAQQWMPLLENEYGRWGGSEDIEKYWKEINAIQEKNRKLNEELNELKLRDPLGDYEKRRKAIADATQNDIDMQLKELQMQREIQHEMLSGREREAEVKRLELEYLQKSKNLSGEELKVFNDNWNKIKEARLAIFDDRTAKRLLDDERKMLEDQAKEVAKAAEAEMRYNEKMFESYLKEQEAVDKLNGKLDDRLKMLKAERDIQLLLDQGNEREAEIKRINLDLDREAASLSEELLETFEKRRGELFASRLETWEQTQALRNQAESIKEMTQYFADQEKAVKDFNAAMDKHFTSMINFSDTLDQELDGITAVMKIEKLRAAGREQEAEELRIKFELDRRELGLNEAQLAVFKERRKELDEMLALQYRQTQEIKEQQAFAEAIKEAEAAAAREQAEQLRLDEEMQDRLIGQMREAAEKRSSVLGSFYREAYKYRETAQEAIRSNSLENIRLQSRIFLNAGVSTAENPAKQSAASLKKMEKQNTDMQQVITSVLRVLNGMSANLRNIGVKAY